MAEMGFNLQVREFKESLVNVINDARIPISVKRMCLTEVYNQVVTIDNQTVNVERQAYLKAVKEEQDELISNKDTLAE